MLTGVSKAWVGNSSNVPIELSNPDSSGANTGFNIGDLCIKFKDEYENWELCDGRESSINTRFVKYDKQLISIPMTTLFDLAGETFGENTNHIIFDGTNLLIPGEVGSTYSGSIRIYHFIRSGNSFTFSKKYGVGGQRYRSISASGLDSNAQYAYFAVWESWDSNNGTGEYDIYKINLSTKSITSYELNLENIDPNVNGDKGDEIFFYGSNGSLIFCASSYKSRDSYDAVFVNASSGSYITKMNLNSINIGAAYQYEDGSYCISGSSNDTYGIGQTYRINNKT